MIEAEAAALQKKKAAAFVWDRQLQLLLCSCLVVVGTDPADIKKKCRIFEDVTHLQLTKQIEKILLQKCGRDLGGVPVDPYRL